MKNRFFHILLIISMPLFLSCSAKKAAPKNVIIIIGDGTGFNQLQAGSLYLHGTENGLTAQNFPLKLAATTYSADGEGYDGAAVQASFDYLKEKPTDSAAAATALSTGTKTYDSAIGVDTLKQPLKHLFEFAEEKGKATGVVTSVPLSHATPAGFIAHNESRAHYHEIAAEMVLRSAADVIMGCGHPYYDDDGQPLPEPAFKYVSEEVWRAVQGQSAGADADGDGAADQWTFIERREDFVRYGEGDAPKRLLGIPQVASTLAASRSGGDEGKEPFSVPVANTLPTLAEMSRAAINVLQRDPDGFYLMIEAGAIDWVCHANNGPRLLEEVVGMEEMVRAVVEWVEAESSWDETVVLVTADHETGYLTGPASGVVKAADGSEKVIYQPLVNNSAGKMPGMEFHSGGHTNSLVPVLAKGVGVEGLFKLARSNDPRQGPYIDNTDIPNYFIQFLQ
ncbi:alkaline phosphatase [candidate division KSB1 bacterium]|nr:alkaline phosphatase [candidate division KSB1 bacterium]